MKTDIHNKGFAVRLALKERLGELGNDPLGGHLVTFSSVFLATSPSWYSSREG